MSEVARRFKISPQAVAQWSAAFQWQKRLTERERLVADLIAQRVVEEEAKSKADALKICRAIQMRFVESLQNKTARIEAGDFEKAVKLELLLRGRATDRSELILGPMFDKLIDLMATVIEREVQDQALRGRLAEGFKEAALTFGSSPVLEIQ